MSAALEVSALHADNQSINQSTTVSSQSVALFRRVAMLDIPTSAADLTEILSSSSHRV